MSLEVALGWLSTVFHRFSRKFRFNRQFEKISAINSWFLALQKLDLVEHFDLVENFAVTNFAPLYV